MRSARVFLAAAALCLLPAASALAQSAYTFTSIANTSGPFRHLNVYSSINSSGTVAFQVIRDESNVVGIFTFGGGSASGSHNLAGGARGSLLSMVTLTDSNFLNEF